MAGETILVVDDDADIREIITIYLEKKDIMLLQLQTVTKL